MPWYILMSDNLFPMIFQAPNDDSAREWLADYYSKAKNVTLSRMTEIPTSR